MPSFSFGGASTTLLETDDRLKSLIFDSALSLKMRSRKMTPYRMFGVLQDERLVGSLDEVYFYLQREERHIWRNTVDERSSSSVRGSGRRQLCEHCAVLCNVGDDGIEDQKKICARIRCQYQPDLCKGDYILSSVGVSRSRSVDRRSAERN